jgi:hypothetical protein
MSAAAPPPTSATLVDPSLNAPIASGGSKTGFGIDLPAAPASDCSGDTASKGYFVYSYIVPDANIQNASGNSDPSLLTYDASNGPDNHGAFPLFAGGTQYGPANTAPTTGQIIQIPNNLAFNPPFASTDLPPGLYDVGIACAKPTTGGPAATDKFFNAQINIVAAPSDPNGYSFTVVGAGTGATTTTSTTVPGGATTTTSTTTTIPGGATTTTTTVPAGGTTTTTSTTTTIPVGGSTTTSTSTTSTTVAGGGTTTTSTTGAVGSDSAGGSGSLASTPVTGSNTLSLIRWGLFLVIVGSASLGLAWRRRRQG